MLIVVIFLPSTHHLFVLQRKLFFKLKSEKQKLENDGFEPSAELISQRLGVPKKDVVEMDQRINGWDVSLDAPLTDDTDTARIALGPVRGLIDRPDGCR